MNRSKRDRIKQACARLEAHIAFLMGELRSAERQGDHSMSRKIFEQETECKLKLLILNWNWSL